MEYLILILSLAGIVFGADFLVAGAVSIARKYHVSDFVIGAAIVGVGTSMPELVVSVLGAVNGNADVAIGNVVGSNIFNILGILGLTSIFFPVAIERKNLKFEIPLCIGISGILTILALNFFSSAPASISRLDGILLLSLFALFMWHSFSRDRKQAESTEEITEQSPIWMAIAKVVGGLTLLIISCDLFVDNAVTIAKAFGVNDAFISLTLIACGTSLPELAASIAAAVKRNTDMALGNIIGSNIFNITLILGISSQVMPLTSSGITHIDYTVMILATVATLIIGLRGGINRLSGAVLVAGFVLYNWYLISSQVSI